MVTIAGSVELDGLEPAIDLAGDVDAVACDLDLRGEGALRPADSAASICPVWFESSSIACLPSTIAGLLLIGDGLEDLGHRERLDLVIRLHQDRPVGAHRQRGAQRLLRLGRADRDRDDLGRDALFLEPDRFLDRDLVERVHAHLDVGEIDPAAVLLTRGWTL